MPESGPHRSTWRRYHPMVWWVVGLQSVFALGFMVLIPLHRGTDEPNHFDQMVRYREEVGYRDPTEPTRRSESVVATLDLAGFREGPLRYEDAVPRPDRPTLAELGSGPHPTSLSQMSQHPPLYYAVSAAASTFGWALLPEGAASWDREMFALRFLGVVFTAGLPLLAAEAVAAIGSTKRAGGYAAALLLLVPGETALRAVVNNDALAIGASSVAIAAGLRVAGDGGRRWVWLASVAAAAALLSKSTSAWPGVWALLVVVGAESWRVRGAPLRTRARTVAVPAALGAIGASWHLANLVRFGDPQPSPVSSREITADDPPAVIEFFRPWVTEVAGSFFGQVAPRTGVALTGWQLAGLTLFVVGLMAAGVVVGLRRHRAPTTLLVALVAVQVALMVRPTLGSFLRTDSPAGFNGRYLYPILVGVVALAALGLTGLVERWSPRWRDSVGWVLIGVGVTLHLVLEWLAVTSRYWDDGGHGVRGRLDAIAAWSPLPVAGTAAIALAQLGVVIAIVVASRRALRARTPVTAGSSA